MDTVTTAPSRDPVLTTFGPPLAAPPAPVPPPAPPAWPQWERVLFRFFFVYLVLQTTPWGLFTTIPGVSWLLSWYPKVEDWAVRAANEHVFRGFETLVPLNGSGDTSWAWTQLWLYLSLAALACVVWTVLDRRRPHYERLAFWLRQFVRYYIAVAALSYGIIKIFALQMPFPTLSQLATPLGDFLPMRFSWMFIGYSVPYQVFSGVMETVAGLLLLNRRTVTAGLFAATGAFLNVVMINLAYDVPVKLYASHLLFACLFLLALDAKRLLGFLVLNTGAAPTRAYDPTFAHPWQRKAYWALQAYIVYAFVAMPFWRGAQQYEQRNAPLPPGPFAIGVYDVRSYVVGRDTVPPSAADTLRWRSVIFDTRGAGSIETRDAMFQRRYGRGYFRFKPDTAARTVAVWKTSTIPRDSTFLFTMRYEVPDTATIRFHTVLRGDSVHVELARVKRHFQLAERQFHWVSEYNR